MSVTDRPETVAAFYERWATIYTHLARNAPGVGRMRRIAVDELRLPPGGTAVDMGCGPGVNFPYLRDAVGSDGRLVGVDVSPAMLHRGERVDPSATVLLGDASRAPLSGPVDGILATFVVTLFDDPADVVDEWWELLAPGGSLAVVNLCTMRGLAGVLGNPLLRAGLLLSTPGTTRFDADLLEVLANRVARAHGAIDNHAESMRYYDSADGLFRVAVGRKY